MFQNRISELFAMSPAEQPMRTNANAVHPGMAMAVQLLPMVTLQDIYQMAAAKARQDYELDKLFNPEYYGDGSGI
jgi:hypothetical protein